MTMETDMETTAVSGFGVRRIGGVLRPNGNHGRSEIQRDQIVGPHRAKENN